MLFCLSFHVWQLWKQRKLNNGENYDKLYIMGFRCRFLSYLWKLCVLSRIFPWLCHCSGYTIVSMWETVHDGIQKTANSFQQNSHHMMSSLCGSLFYLTNKGIQPSTICMRQIFNNSTQHYLILLMHIWQFSVPKQQANETSWFYFFFCILTFSLDWNFMYFKTVTVSEDLGETSSHSLSSSF